MLDGFAKEHFSKWSKMFCKYLLQFTIYMSLGSWFAHYDGFMLATTLIQG
jgi:hypothetical protein